MPYYQNKLVLITGGSSGIGLSLSRQLAQQGANVWILARRPEFLDKALAEIETCRSSPSQKFGKITADVGNEIQINNELSAFIKAVGIPDILINCAGFAIPGMFTDMATDVFHQEMDVIYFGTVYTTKNILPGMLLRGSGHIINVASMGAFISTIGYTPYCGAKFALRGFTDTLRTELKKTGVKISIVFPPDTKTPGFEIENQRKPLVTKFFSDNGGTFEPEDVAKIILKDAAKGKYNILPGFTTKGWWFAYGFGMAFNFLNPVMDMFLDDAWKKTEKAEKQQASTAK